MASFVLFSIESGRNAVVFKAAKQYSDKQRRSLEVASKRLSAYDDLFRLDVTIEQKAGDYAAIERNVQTILKNQQTKVAEIKMQIKGKRRDQELQKLKLQVESQLKEQEAQKISLSGEMAKLKERSLQLRMALMQTVERRDAASVSEKSAPTKTGPASPDSNPVPARNKEGGGR